MLKRNGDHFVQGQIMTLRFARYAAAFAALAIFAGAQAATNRPLYGDAGFDATGMDRSAAPGTDFFRYANGHWLDTHTIPADKPAVTLRLEMTDRTLARLRDMMEAASAHSGPKPADLEGKVGAFYRAFMDENRIESLGAKPIEPELNDARSAKTRDDLAALMGRSNADFESGLFNVVIDVDLKDPKRYAVYLSQSGLGLPDRDYYLKPEFAAAKAKYRAYAAELLKRLGWPDADAQAQAVVAFETKIAAASWTKAQQRDLDAVYNPMTTDALARLAPGFAWSRFLADASLG